LVTRALVVWSDLPCPRPAAKHCHPVPNDTQGMYTQAAVTKTVWNMQGRAWRAWLEYVEDRHAAKAKIQNAAAFWQNRQAALAFQQWQEHVQIAHEMKAKAAVIIGRLMNSTQVTVSAVLSEFHLKLSMKVCRPSSERQRSLSPAGSLLLSHNQSAALTMIMMPDTLSSIQLMIVTCG